MRSSPPRITSPECRIQLSALNNHVLPDVLHSLPSKIGLEFDLSAIASWIYGAVLVLTMLLRPAGLVPGRG